MNEWDGEERRTDDVNVRLALLEKCQSDTERRHAENKESLIAIHKRISQIKEEFADEVKNGFRELLEKMDSKNAHCEAHGKKTAAVETDIKVLKGGITAAWAVILTMMGLKQ